VRRRAKEVAASVALPAEEDAELAVNTADLMHLRRVVEEKDGGPAWIHMMDRTLPTFRYQAWRRDMEVCTTLLSFFLARLQSILLVELKKFLLCVLVVHNWYRLRLDA
jgi:hypothetical protein